jgi:hypothetical protein
MSPELRLRIHCCLMFLIGGTLISVLPVVILQYKSSGHILASRMKSELEQGVFLVYTVQNDTNTAVLLP